MLIRRFRADDTADIMKLFSETILTVNLGDYTEKQVRVWASSDMSPEMWKERLGGTITYVADLDGKIAGFGNLLENGEIDLLYVHKDHQRCGIASALLVHLESSAKTMGLEELLTEASITAKPFFEQHDFKVLKKQNKFYKGMSFITFMMRKTLA